MTPQPQHGRKTGGIEKTERLVLKEERVLVLGDVPTEKVTEALKVLGIRNRAEQSAWVVLGEAKGSKAQAVEQHAGKPGTPDAKPGVYRAPSLRGWKGRAVYEKPPEPVADRKLFTD